MPGAHPDLLIDSTLLAKVGALGLEAGEPLMERIKREVTADPSAATTLFVLAVSILFAQTLNALPKSRSRF